MLEVTKIICSTWNLPIVHADLHTWYHSSKQITHAPFNLKPTAEFKHSVVSINVTVTSVNSES